MNNFVSDGTIALAETDIREAVVNNNLSTEEEINDLLNEVVDKYDINFHEVVSELSNFAEQFIG